VSTPTLGPPPAGVASAAGAVADRAAGLLRRLSLPAKAAQLLMPRIGGGYLARAGAEYERLRGWVTELGIGGVLVGMGPPLEIAARLNALQEMAALPLLAAADVESGPGRILDGGVILPYGLENGGGTRFPPLMAFGATADEAAAYELGRVTALECRAVGLHVALAPVADVNSNPLNPIINTRSFGADPQQVARLVAALVSGLQDHGMIATAKHFPGHGDAATDSHLELPCVTADAARLDAVELVPFRAAIAAGTGAIMTAHLALPALTGDRVPVTLHPQLLRTLLRAELGFDGLVFSDALDMAAVARDVDGADACIAALRAGVDVLLQVPTDGLERCHAAVVRAVEQARIDEAVLDAAVLRVLRAKIRLGLFEHARVDVEAAARTVGAEQHRAAAARIAERAVTILRADDNVLPLRGRRVAVAVAADTRDPFAGRSFMAELAAHGADARVTDIEHAADEDCDVVLLALFTRAGAGTDATLLDDALVAYASRIAHRRPLAVVSFGSPYHLPRFAAASALIAAWAGWEPMQGAAARVLCGTANAEGRLPAPLPPLYAAGAGGAWGAEFTQ
jgi:beta-N-acetylhexosaminidase